MFRAIVLGIVQGLTEFLPISSSAHLVLVPYVAGWGVESPIPGTPALAFDVAIHLGTLLAVVVYFARDIAAILAGSSRFARGDRSEASRTNARLLGLLAVGSVPAVLAGGLLKETFEQAFHEPQLTAVLLFGTAALLVFADWMHDRRQDHREIGSLGVVDALVIGTMQALAILPGISRSGATITGGVARGLSREAAARFSFLLAIPAIVGAAVLTAFDLEEIPSWGPVVAGTIASGVVGFASIAFLLRYLRTNRLRPFAIYCVIFGLTALAYWTQVK